MPTVNGDWGGDGDGVHTQDCVRHVLGPQETRVNEAHSPDEGPDTHERPERTEESTQEESEERRNRGIVYIARGSSQLSSLQLQNLAETRNKYTHHRSRHARPSPHGSDPRFAGSRPGHRRRAVTHREGKDDEREVEGSEHRARYSLQLNALYICSREKHSKCEMTGLVPTLCCQK